MTERLPSSSKAMVDHKMGEEFSKQNLLDKLYEAKIQEMRKNEILARDKIKSLNDKKKDILEQELKVAERKGVPRDPQAERAGLLGGNQHGQWSRPRRYREEHRSGPPGIP